ncbi:MAG TPA: hypothetical protein VMN39_00215, partial [Longimicrobiaceae bacterium]|nr:hypothetical protein [Longimicrobiaceae bacterium]
MLHVDLAVPALPGQERTVIFAFRYIRGDLAGAGNELHAYCRRQEHTIRRLASEDGRRTRKVTLRFG